MVQAPQFIYFDLGNVLFHFDHWRACQQVGQLIGRSPDEIWEILFATDTQIRFERGELSGEEVYARFCARSGSRPDFEALVWAMTDIFSLNVPVVPIVAQLRAVGCRLGILSNTCETHWRYLAGPRFAVVGAYFETAVLSYEERQLKPERGIYTSAARRAGVPAGRIFFVDDKPENVAGAQRAGWHAVQYSTPQQLAAALRARGCEFNY